MKNQKKLVLSIILIVVLVFQASTCFAADIKDTLIYQKWLIKGGTSGFLGNPISDTTITPNGLGIYNHFQGGSIYRKNTFSDAFEVHGMIRDKWAQLGWETSFLGFPVSDETDTYNQGGRYNDFEGGSIFYKWGAPSAYEVHGMIRDKWAQLGWETSFLGYPVSDETDTYNQGGRYNDFEGGSIFYKWGAPSAHEIHGDIRGLWSWLGWESCALGYPTTDEYSVNGKQASHFDNGAIYWTPTSGAWPMMSGPCYTTSPFVSQQLSVSYEPLQFFGTYISVSGRGFNPNKDISVYISDLWGPYQIASVRTNSNGEFSYNSRNYAQYIGNTYIDKVNGYITVFARENGYGPAAIYSSACYGVGFDVTLD